MVKLLFSACISANASRSYPRLPGRRRVTLFSRTPDPSLGIGSELLLRYVCWCGFRWFDNVVPFAVEVVGLELWLDGEHLGVADLDASGVAVVVCFGVDGEAGPGGGGA